MERKKERAAAKKAKKAAAKKAKTENTQKEEKLMPQYTAKELKQAETIRREQQRERDQQKERGIFGVKCWWVERKEIERAAALEVKKEEENVEEWVKRGNLTCREKSAPMYTPPFLLIFIFSFLLFFSGSYKW